MEENGMPSEVSCDGVEHNLSVEDLANKSPMKTNRIVTQTSPTKQRAKQPVVNKRKRKLPEMDGHDDEELQQYPGGTLMPLKLSKFELPEQTEMHSGNTGAQATDDEELLLCQNEADRTGSEADYSYNLEMLGDVALQNSDVHSSQEFAATSTPQRTLVSNRLDGSPSNSEGGSGIVMSDFEMARQALGMFTPEKDKKRRRKESSTGPINTTLGVPPLTQNVDILSQGGSMLHPSGLTKVMSYASSNQVMDTADLPDDTSNGAQKTMLTSAMHKILVTSDVPVKFSGVVKIVDDIQEPLAGVDESQYVIQELGSVNHFAYATEGPYVDEKAQDIQSGQAVEQNTNCKSGTEMTCIEIRENSQSLQNIEDDLFTTAHELGISIQN